VEELQGEIERIVERLQKAPVGAKFSIKKLTQTVYVLKRD